MNALRQEALGTFRAALKSSGGESGPPDARILLECLEHLANPRRSHADWLWAAVEELDQVRRKPWLVCYTSLLQVVRGRPYDSSGAIVAILDFSEDHQV